MNQPERVIKRFSDCIKALSALIALLPNYPYFLDQAKLDQAIGSLNSAAAYLKESLPKE